MAGEHSERGFLGSAAEMMSEKLHLHRSSSSSSSDDESKPSIAVVTENAFNRLFGRKSSVHAALGGGKLADSMLWRDKQRSASILVGATMLWILLECMDYYFLTFVCHVLILSLVTLFVWINSAVFLKRNPPHIPKIMISEDSVQRAASEIRSDINALLGFLHRVATGRDIKKYLIVIGSLWILAILGSCCDFLTLVYVLVLVSHTVPVLYEKYEDQVDSFSDKALRKIREQYKVIDAKLLSKIPRRPLKEKKQS
eukprot:TRINITY_DN31250_c0_g1_i1.p1 TRINITY_DN31250_c0_g1~~TRINITY_DN31250_c0_g1_i1.p1  ORF type:complete len:255 (+),score=11.56 TRINITY_DN31250_c0_g1_i1:213-977(+)